MDGKFVAGFGEIMLRLCPQERKRFAQAMPGQLDATFGGGEANVCVSLALLGENARYLTALPDNAVANACLTQLRGLKVDVEQVKLTKDGRMGVYYAEHGAAQRGSNVLYDREYSVISQLGAEDYDFAAMLENVSHLHITGITPSLSQKAFEATLALAKYASEQGIRISCDLNYRKKLWRWRPGTDPRALAGECMEQIVKYVDWIVCNEEDASDVFGIKSENTSIEEGKIDAAGYQDVARKLVARFPKVSYVAITLRESYSANHNNWGGMIYDTSCDKAFFAPLDCDGNYRPYEIHNIVDRFGGGDSFCAGIIYALRSRDYCEPEKAIRFAVASSCLKHSIHGDYNFSTLAEVTSLMNGGGSGRVMR